MPRLDRSDYTVGWLCALPLSELVAAKRMLDESHEPLRLDAHDDNSYAYGSINGHNVVIACLPPGQPGTVSAARLIQPLSRSFPNMRMHLLVGIGGGVPYNPPLDAPEKDIHLGDVVVGWADETGAPAVVQYDLVRREEGGVTSSLCILDKPHWRLLDALGHLLARHSNHETNFPDHLQRVRDLEGFSHPGREKDRLFQSDYRHVGGPSCSECDTTRLVVRRARINNNLIFHQGTIASGNSVVKDAELRDRISRENHGALCFEMEGAGIMDDKHCLVIRGIADYADSHKNGSWQKYAAATAAAFAREFLCTIQPQNVSDTRSAVLSPSASFAESSQAPQQSTSPTSATLLDAQLNSNHGGSISSAGAILLPKLFFKDLLTLGQFLPNPLRPTINPCKPSCDLLTPNDYIETPSTPFEALVPLNKKGLFSTNFMYRLGLKPSSGNEGIIHIKSEGLVYRTLANSDATFAKICGTHEAREWIESTTKYSKKPFYFVVGLQELKGATLTEAVLRPEHPHEYTKMPLDASRTAAFYGRGLRSGGLKVSEWKNVEGVLGVEVRQVRSRIGHPVLGSKVSWKYSHQQTKGAGQSQELAVLVDLETLAGPQELIENEDDEDDEDDDDDDDDKDDDERGRGERI